MAISARSPGRDLYPIEPDGLRKESAVGVQLGHVRWSRRRLVPAPCGCPPIARVRLLPLVRAPGCSTAFVSYKLDLVSSSAFANGIVGCRTRDTAEGASAVILGARRPIDDADAAGQRAISRFT